MEQHNTEKWPKNACKKWNYYHINESTVLILICHQSWVDLDCLKSKHFNWKITAGVDRGITWGKWLWTSYCDLAVRDFHEPCHNDIPIAHPRLQISGNTICRDLPKSSPKSPLKTLKAPLVVYIVAVLYMLYTWYKCIHLPKSPNSNLN